VENAEASVGRKERKETESGGGTLKGRVGQMVVATEPEQVSAERYF
jgi:hypothetical protein